MAGWSQGEICKNKNAILQNKSPLGILLSASGVSVIYSSNVTKEMGTCFFIPVWSDWISYIKEIGNINFLQNNSSCSD